MNQKKQKQKEETIITPHIDFYEKCMQSGVMPISGLCRAVNAGLIYEEIFRLFYPTAGDIDVLIQEDKILSSAGTGFWACDLPLSAGYERCDAFTPLRQNIVLFMAAINNEIL